MKCLARAQSHGGGSLLWHHRTLDGGHGRSCAERCHSRRCAPASDVGIRMDDGGGSVVHAPVRNGGQLVTRRGISIKVVVQFAIGNALVV